MYKISLIKLFFGACDYYYYYFFGFLILLSYEFYL